MMTAGVSELMMLLPDGDSVGQIWTARVIYRYADDTIFGGWDTIHYAYMNYFLLSFDCCRWRDERLRVSGGWIGCTLIRAATSASSLTYFLHGTILRSILAILGSGLSLIKTFDVSRSFSVVHSQRGEWL